MFQSLPREKVRNFGAETGPSNLIEFERNTQILRLDGNFHKKWIKRSPEFSVFGVVAWGNLGGELRYFGA
jgi:hypothetical protein